MRCCILLLLCLSFQGSVYCQTPASTPPATPETGRSQPEQNQPEKDQSPDYRQSPDYHLGPGDALKITVAGIRNLSLADVKVSNSGKIHLPYLGVVPVADLTPIELEAEIATRLKNQKLVKDPQVQVLVTEYRAQPVYILGEVGMPGQYVLRDKTYLMDLITWAAGVNDVARDYGLLYRRNPYYRPPEPGQTESKEPLYQITKVDLRPLLAGGNMKLDLVLQGGDLFYVPQKETSFYFVVGDVNQTGLFSLGLGEKLWVSRALAAAGGPTRTARLSKGVVVRLDETGQRREIPVDFGAIFKGKKPDFPVQADDIIFIPGSHVKTIAMGVLGIMPRLAERKAYSHTGVSAY
ncbi:MAG: polysaccharide biosynthesis/export family protein [Acidobacteriota bacterium]